MHRAGALRWIQTLHGWPDLDDYNSASRQALFNPDTHLPEAFVKAHDRFSFYWILGAGHSVRRLSACMHDSRRGIKRLAPSVCLSVCLYEVYICLSTL